MHYIFLILGNTFASDVSILYRNNIRSQITPFLSPSDMHRVASCCRAFDTDLSPILCLRVCFTAMKDAHLLGRAQARGCNGEPKPIITLLSAGHFRVNAHDEFGWTSLHYAAKRGRPHHVTQLLENGADPNRGDAEGWTPLHVAAKWDFLIGDMLLRRSANVNQATKKGETPLHFAAYYGLDRIGGILLAHGASVNVVSSKGWKPIHYAKWCLELRRNIPPESSRSIQEAREGAIRLKKLLLLNGSENTDIPRSQEWCGIQ